MGHSLENKVKHRPFKKRRENSLELFKNPQLVSSTFSPAVGENDVFLHNRKSKFTYQLVVTDDGKWHWNFSTDDSRGSANQWVGCRHHGSPPGNVLSDLFKFQFKEMESLTWSKQTWAPTAENVARRVGREQRSCNTKVTSVPVHTHTTTTRTTLTKNGLKITSKVKRQRKFS